MKDDDFYGQFPCEYCYESWRNGKDYNPEVWGQCVNCDCNISSGGKCKKSMRGQHIMSDKGKENDTPDDETENDRPNTPNFVQPPQIPDMSMTPETDWRIYVDARLSRFESAIEALVDVVCDKYIYIITCKSGGRGKYNMFMFYTLDKAMKKFKEIKDNGLEPAMIKGFVVEGEVDIES